MNSQQERAVFEAWGWAYNYVDRMWVSPDGAEYITTDDLMEAGSAFEDDVMLMAIIVELGVRQEKKD